MDPLPRFWQAARSGMLTVWGWSERSADEAVAIANERLAHSLKAIRAGIPRTRKGSYGWAPPREETLHEVHDDDELVGIVSRNRYGADVLGTDRLLIADVDVPEQTSFATPLRRLFGRGKGKAVEESPRARALRVIQEFAARNPYVGLRAYETFGGYRVIVTGSRLRPDSPEAAAFFDQLGTDRVYAHLCRKYNTCRARLTPKPWRCGIRQPAPAWPPETDYAATETANWITEYQRATSGFATCRLAGTFGPPPDAVEAQLIDLHDRATRIAAGQLPLA